MESFWIMPMFKKENGFDPTQRLSQMKEHQMKFYSFKWSNEFQRQIELCKTIKRFFYSKLMHLFTLHANNFCFKWRFKHGALIMDKESWQVCLKLGIKTVFARLSLLYF